MANNSKRVNWHSTIYTHANYADLVVEVSTRFGLRGVALASLVKGLLVHAFELTQDHWLTHGGVPEDKWPADLDALISTGFARREAGERGPIVYVAGSRDHFSWLSERSEAGKRGAQRSNETQNSKRQQTSAKRSKPQQTQQTSPSFSSSVSFSSSSSSSGSVSEKSNTGEQLVSAETTPARSRVHEVIGVYCEGWKTRYSSAKNPHVEPKHAKRLKDFISSVGADRTVELMKAYFCMNDGWFLTRSHDIETFLGNVNKISLFADTGKQITRNEINAIDRTQTTLSTLEKLRAGHI